MPINKYRLEDFQSWIDSQRWEEKSRWETTAVNLGTWDLIWNTETSSFAKEPSGFTQLGSSFHTGCNACCEKWKPNDRPHFMAPPDDSCLNPNCLKIKNIWKHCVQNRDFRILNAPQCWLFNALGETAHDVILKWMNEVDQKKTQSLEQEEKFIQNQLVLAPKK